MVCLARFHNSDRFGSHLSSLGFKLTPAHLRTLTIDELSELKERVVTSCLNRSSSGFFSGAVLGASQVAETVVMRSPLGKHLFLHGFTEALRRDETTCDMLDLIELTSDISKGSPMLLLAYALLSNAGRVHSVNRFLQMRAAMAQAEEENVGDKKDVHDTQPRHDGQDGMFSSSGHGSDRDN